MRAILSLVIGLAILVSSTVVMGVAIAEGDELDENPDVICQQYVIYLNSH